MYFYVYLYIECYRINYIHIYLVIKVYVSLHDCLSMEKYVDIKKVYHREIIANILIVKPFYFVKVQDC